jgi:hypothetical protein
MNQHERLRRGLRLCCSSARACRQTCNSHCFQDIPTLHDRCSLDFCSGSLRSAGTHQCIRVSIKGVRIMGQGVWSMIRKSMPSGHDPMGGYRFSEKIMLKQKDRAE